MQQDTFDHAERIIDNSSAFRPTHKTTTSESVEICCAFLKNTTKFDKYEKSQEQVKSLQSSEIKLDEIPGLLQPKRKETKENKDTADHTSPWVIVRTADSRKVE